jgi:hypothetical protein
MSFDLRRVRFYEWMLVLFGAALIGVMFARWYSVGVGGSVLARVDAWQAFSVIDVVLVIVGALAIGVAAAAATHRTAALAQALAALATLAGGVATILLVIRAASPPELADAMRAGAGSVTREAGLWLGLVCSIGIAVCGWRSMADEHFPAVMRSHLDVERLELPSDNHAATSS